MSQYVEGCQGCGTVLGAFGGAVVGCIAGYEIAKELTDSVIVGFIGGSAGLFPGGIIGWGVSAIGIGLGAYVANNLGRGSSTSKNQFSGKKDLEMAILELEQQEQEARKDLMQELAFTLKIEDYRGLQGAEQKSYTLETSYGPINLRKDTFGVYVESLTDFASNIKSREQREYAHDLAGQVGLYFSDVIPTQRVLPKTSRTTPLTAPPLEKKVLTSKVCHGSERELAGLAYRVRLAETKLEQNLANGETSLFTSEEVSLAEKQDFKLYR